MGVFRFKPAIRALYALASHDTMKNLKLGTPQ